MGPGVCFAVDLVIRVAREISVTSTPPLVDLLLPEGSGSRLVFGPVLSGVGVKSGNLPLGIVLGVLKGLLNWVGVVILSSSQGHIH